MGEGELMFQACQAFDVTTLWEKTAFRDKVRSTLAQAAEDRLVVSTFDVDARETVYVARYPQRKFGERGVAARQRQGTGEHNSAG